MIRPEIILGESRLASLRAKARELVHTLAAQARFTGSLAEEDARGVCAAELARSGFEVSEQRFTFSEFPARWGPPLGAIVAIGLAALTGFLAAKPGGASVGLVVLGTGLALLGWASAKIARKGIVAFPWMRSTGTNLIATRGRHRRNRPSVWLVAHLDSKSQTIPMLLRVASIVGLTLTFAGLLLALIAGTVVQFGPESPGFLALGELAADLVLVFFYLIVASALPIVFCLVGNRSHGAVDNASGVATVLACVHELDSLTPIGILISSGEELGLAGARAFVARRPERGVALNCDTIDDDGRFIFMASGGRPPLLAAALSKAADRLGIHASVIPMLPGVLADNIAFSDAGWESCTVSRGNLATLARVHTARDRPEFIEGTGIAQAARLLVATVEELS